MNIVYGSYPPNIEDIKKVFDLSNRPHVVFTYGNFLYIPSGIEAPEHLIVHEKVHVKQQGSDPKKWWDKYLVDKEFRLSQELEAYRDQYKFIRQGIKDRNQLFRFLRMLALDLSSEIYGSVISYQEALSKIK